MKCLRGLQIHGDRMEEKQMAGIILRKTGVAVLVMLKVLFQAVLMIVKLFVWGIKLLLLLFGLVARVVLAFAGAVI